MVSARRASGTGNFRCGRGQGRHEDHPDPGPQVADAASGRSGIARFAARLEGTSIVVREGAGWGRASRSSSRPRRLEPESGRDSVRAMIRRAALLLLCSRAALCTRRRRPLAPHPRRTSRGSPPWCPRGRRLHGLPRLRPGQASRLGARGQHRQRGRIDAATAKVTRIEGFPPGGRAQRNKRTVGPSSASIGDGVVYVGDRADFSICAVDAESMKKGACLTLDSSPDAVAWVAATKEVW